MHAAECNALPDLADPATRGCLLALVREAWDEPRAYIENDVDGYGWRWVVLTLEGDQQQTEVEALVAALEAAPR